MKKKNTILVIDDEPAILKVMEANLKQAGYHVHTAESGLAGLEKLKSEAFDTVISDYSMPQLTGLELLEEMKKLAIDVPVLVVTAYGTIDKAIEAMKDGAADYLVKPFEPEVLVATISQYISQNDSDFTMIAIDPMMQEVASLAKRVSGSDATVMITGKSGTGKAYCD